MTCKTNVPTLIADNKRGTNEEKRFVIVYSKSRRGKNKSENKQKLVQHPSRKKVSGE